MARNQGLAQLRDLLAGLYPTELASRQVVEEAGRPTDRIEFSAAATTNWQNILRGANRRNQVPYVLAVACQDYPERGNEVHAIQ
jgi:hypothetical protein